MSNTIQKRAELTQEIVEKMAQAIQKEFDTDVFYTGSNLNTISISCGEIDGKEVFGSFHFTLHKSNWDLDEEILKNDEFRDEKELKAKLEQQRAAEKQKKIEDKKLRAEKRKQEQQRMADKRQKNIKILREQIN